MLSRRLGMVVVTGLMLLGCLQVASATNVVVVLKEGMDLQAGGDLDAAFSSASSANVVDRRVHDTYFDVNSASYYTVFGDDIEAVGKCLFKFDLSMIPANSTIVKAQLRLYSTGGYGDVTCAAITTHDWSEDEACMAGPDHPVSPDLTWGPNSDSLFSTADYATPTSFESYDSGWWVKDVTADVQSFVNGQMPNYGWFVYAEHYLVLLSENIRPGPAYRPALFVEFDPGFDMAPVSVDNLTVSSRELHSLTLSWRAPIDDNGTDNAAAAYDVRYSTFPIDESNWASATQVTANVPVPGTPSTLESLEVQGLAANTVYYFAIKSIDQANNISAISNCAMGQTYAEESVAPADASDLQAVDVRSTNLTLNWTATGDDGTTGTAAHYDVRMSTSQITQANFDAATQVPNNIVPRESSTPESLFVEGLTPGTTYWFAIKVGDETYNWSAATIISLATPNDQTAPAAVSDLTVTGGDAFSANLTWTATGDDGTNGTASGYEIRYATSQIDANNWDSASVMPNAIAPQAASSTEQFTVSGLQPGTTYYFAIKVMDEAGNVSAISNGATRTTSADPSLPLITSVTLAEQDGVTTDG